LLERARGIVDWARRVGWSNHWVKAIIKVPSEWQKYERVQLEFDPRFVELSSLTWCLKGGLANSCEALIYNTEGLPLQAITGGFSDDRRVEHILSNKARAFTYTASLSLTFVMVYDQTELADLHRVGLFLTTHPSLTGWLRRVACNAMFGLNEMKGDPGYEHVSFKLNSADLVAPRMEAWHLLWVRSSSSLLR
jgi:alpha-mannosidase